MKFCKWIIELNRTSFLILWHCGAIWYIYNGYFKNIVSYLFLAGCILIFLFKIGNLTQINKVINFLKNSPLNIVIGSLGTGKTAFLVYASKLLKKKKYHIASTFSLLETQKLSLGHMGLLDFDYPVLPDKTLLLWDETNLFLEGTDWEKNNTKNEETGIQEYFALARHFGHIVLASGQRDKHIWVKVRDIANNVIVGIRKKPVNIFRPYLKVIYGTFTSIEEYERWRNTLIDAKNSKKGRRIKYRDIPELDIYFFKLKIPLPILNTYNSFYLAFLRDYLNAKVNPDYEDKYYTDTAIDLEDLEYLKMNKFSKFLRKMKEKEQ
ncbi:hypothetical protein [Spiroplasma endosymbiont of Dilophus febrilis]|uniref:hypothetical protein n=1 Tax=Spiroplasma endosymbiont of Dilophus febrilis TaxID=3066292 RepID=UPI00313DF93C